MVGVLNVPGLDLGIRNRMSVLATDAAGDTAQTVAVAGWISESA
jgi:hypothetical protein